jgi:hypothetical protein
VSGPGILKPIVVDVLGVFWIPKITERTWWLKLGTSSVQVASSRYYAILGRGQQFENQITRTLMSMVRGSKEWFVFYLLQNGVMGSNLTQGIMCSYFRVFLRVLLLCVGQPFQRVHHIRVHKESYKKSIWKKQSEAGKTGYSKLHFSLIQGPGQRNIKNAVLATSILNLLNPHDTYIFQPFYRLKNTSFYTQGVYVSHMIWITESCCL